MTGASAERIISDYVDWSVEVSQSGASQQASYQGLQPAVEQTVDFLKAQGIEADEMELDSVKSEKQEVRDPRTGELLSTSWTTTQVVLIGSWNVANIYKISSQIVQLIGKGVPLRSLRSQTPTPARSRSPRPTQRNPVTAAPTTPAQSRRTSLR